MGGAVPKGVEKMRLSSRISTSFRFVPPGKSRENVPDPPITAYSAHGGDKSLPIIEYPVVIKRINDI
jgi:hypothetical protein